jgi:two-component system, chemotaxis family, protein-glutamate methylesterase/glutaminase
VPNHEYRNGGAPRRDIVVVGASAGGVEALIRLVGDLPHDFPAAVFVVLHLPPGGKSHLPHILARSGPLETASAEDGEPIEPGRIYVGPPDCHLLLGPGKVELGGGPKENGHRPAIDPLFRSAARHYGPRVIAAVLSGTLDDGTAGLRVVRASGGMTIVQDPDDALYPAMPLNAIAGARPEHVVPLGELPALLTELTRATVDEDKMQDFDEDAMESDYAVLPPDLPEGEPPGEPSGFTCPECGGALWELEEGELTRFRCRVGHAYSAASLLAGHSDALEAALWTGYRALEERAAMAKRIAERLRKRGQGRTAQRFDAQVLEAETQARTLRKVLLNLQALPDTAPGLEEQAAASKARG